VERVYTSGLRGSMLRVDYLIMLAMCLCYQCCVLLCNQCCITMLLHSVDEYFLMYCTVFFLALFVATRTVITIVTCILSACDAVV